MQVVNCECKPNNSSKLIKVYEKGYYAVSQLLLAKVICKILCFNLFDLLLL